MQKPDFLPAHIHWHTATDADTLAQQLAHAVADELHSAIARKHHASLAVSGGNTPKAMLAYLSAIELPWSHTQVTLVDERFVDINHPASNEAMVRQHLLQNHASQAHFVPLFHEADLADNMTSCEQALKQMRQPLDLVILGMGNDGHTASLFPQCPHLPAAMDEQSLRLCIDTQAPVEPKQRITWTARPLLQARQRYLHLVGADKLATLEEAMGCKSVYKMPIFAFLQRPMTIFWSGA